jgi:hypothetical protein
MIDIQNNQENRISFLEFTLEIPKDLIHAFQTFARIRDGRVERTRKEWLEMYSAMMRKTTN